MRIRSVFILSFLLCYSASGGNISNDCSNPLTQSAMNICSNVERKALETELSEALESLKLPDCWEGLVQRMMKVQDEWRIFANKHCRVFADVYEGGTMWPLINNSCLSGMLKSRIEQIGYFEKHVCR